MGDERQRLIEKIGFMEENLDDVVFVIEQFTNVVEKLTGGSSKLLLVFNKVTAALFFISQAPEIAKIIAAAFGIKETIFGDPVEDFSWEYFFEKLNEGITDEEGKLDSVEGLKFAIEVLELDLTGTAELLGMSNIAVPLIDFLDTNAIQPIINKLADMRDSIYNTWDTVADWFSENVVNPIATLFGGLSIRIHQIFEGIQIIVLTVWSSIVGFFAPMIEKIKEIWEELTSWIEKNVVEPVAEILGKLSEYVEITFTCVLNAVITDVESAINFLIGQVNGLLEGFNEIVSWAAKIAKVDWEGVELIPEISIPRISWYKSGGMLPDNYTLIGAGENGVPEIMGTVGGRAAIAGGEEITGIRDEIRATADEEITLLKEQNMLLQAILEKEFGVTTDAIGKGAKKYAQDYYLRTGKAAYVY